MVGILLLVVVVIAWIAWEVQVGGAGACPGTQAAQIGAGPTRIVSPGEVSRLLAGKEAQSVSDSRRQAQSASSATEPAVLRTCVVGDEREWSHRWAVSLGGAVGSKVTRLRTLAGPAGPSSRLFSVWSLRCRKDGAGWVPTTGRGKIPPNLYVPALN